MSDINIKLFKLIKNHNWDEFKKIVENNDDIDLNIRDNSQNYLIQYAIIYNKHDLVKLLILKNCKLDIYDTDGRSILFNPIKFNYIEIIEYILEYESKNIGISLNDMQDSSGFNPIHYAVFFKNIDALKLFKKYNKSFNVLNNEFYLPLHLAVQTKNFPIFEFVLQNTKDIDFQTKQGETSLHLSCTFIQKKMTKLLIDNNANVNIQDFENEIVPLMYTILYNEYELFDLLLQKTNLEIQDRNGFNALHYCIRESVWDFIDKLVDKQIDLNITNIEGHTPLHLFLDSIRNSNDTNYNFNLENIIKNTDLNIQDNEGRSCLLLMCKYNIWKKFSSILETKKLNIYIKNKDGRNALFYILENDRDNFFEIVAKSYLQIIRSKESKKFNNEVINICKKQIPYKDFNILNSIINNSELENFINKKDKDICLDVLTFLIKKNNLPYPRSIKNYCIDLNEFNQSINFITYTGTPLDVLFGLIYLNSKYDYSKTTLSNNFLENPLLNSYYLNEKNRRANKQDFINFEIIWDGIKIFFPTNLKDNITKFKNNKSYRFLIIPIGIELENGAHSNILIYDKQINEIERFEPNGSSFPFKFNYDPFNLDLLLKEYFLNIFPNSKYIEPQIFLPKIGFQVLESYDHFKTKKIGDPGGFCAVWCVWYADMRMKYITLPRHKLVKKLIIKIKEENIQFKTLIRNYAKRIIDLRDEILTESKIDINDWLNSNYDLPIYENLIINIKKKIASITEI